VGRESAVVLANAELLMLHLSRNLWIFSCIQIYLYSSYFAVKHVLGRCCVVKGTLFLMSFVYPCLRRAESDPGASIRGLQLRY
jgi:hypothetical protein